MLYRMDKMTKSQREHFGYLMDVLSQLEWDLHQPVVARGRIPPEWHEIANTRYPKKKRKVTLWVEEDVVRFFKKMGRGYTLRMNEVLVAFMLARLSGLIDGKDTLPEYQTPPDMGERPGIGK
ncbi:BrnA antitoxin family protein [Roseovarius sp. CAU 1744]|uniref:BrnA antitoxin family protein n=1 Tax=Roseovarius sp. CAU 1744 TaxID=3140368 RepID=UPI00325B3FB8